MVINCVLILSNGKESMWQDERDERRLHCSKIKARRINTVIKSASFRWSNIIWSISQFNLNISSDSHDAVWESEQPLKSGQLVIDKYQISINTK